MRRKFWFFALLLVPLALAIPLYLASTWRAHAFGVHPFAGQAPVRVAPGALITGPQFRLMMARDGARLLSVSTHSKPFGLAMWDVASGRVLWKMRQSGPRDWNPLCFSPDGQMLVMASNPNPTAPVSALERPALTMFEAANGRPIAVMSERIVSSSYGFTGAAFSPDGRMLRAFSDRGLTAWNLAVLRPPSNATPSATPRATPSATPPRILANAGSISVPLSQLSPTSQQLLVNWSDGTGKSSRLRTRCAI